jgi:uncharacterized membrane protein
MKPLIVLLSAFSISLLIIYVLQGIFDFTLAGRISMSSMLAFTAVGHFAFTKGMSMMIPPFVPFKTKIVYLTGIIEIIAAVGLLIPDFKILTAWLLIVFFILILPANIYAGIKHVDYQKASFSGKGFSYLWFRVPLQILFIIWTYLSAING